MLSDYENIVIIPSLIYSNHGRYSKDERFEQTKVTITSVKEKIPNSFIILIDISPFNADEISYFENNCDLFINPSNDNELAEKIINRKSYGEKTYLEYVLALLDNNDQKYNYTNFTNVKHIFKVGGRYFLNEHFDYYKNYNHDYDNINIHSPDFYSNACNSSCFKISKTNINHFIDSLKLYDSDVKSGTVDMERMLYRHIHRIPGITKQIDVLGMTCLCAIAPIYPTYELITYF